MPGPRAIGHVALLGDSIFDNASYVPGEPPVVEQLRAALPKGWNASLLAVDGASAADVHEQLERLSGDETHLFVSVGGNDALNASHILTANVRTVAEAQDLVEQAQALFRREYEALARAVSRRPRPAVFCTVYDAIPGLGEAARVALTAFNDIILRTSFRSHAPVIDLRLVCDAAADYSTISPIEPSSRGGAKIAQVIAVVARDHDFSASRSVVYP
ncbi:MAG TPA: GDSL-type esterase/lipase family protein [Candidatus Dormibacteraeota bacterium]|nr:GDSL-type esterase/lipase family protein [Candidatus Dormibacteraeota bacterium]